MYKNMEPNSQNLSNMISLEVCTLYYRQFKQRRPGHPLASYLNINGKKVHPYYTYIDRNYWYK
jgi:hypothetical protein